MFELTISTCKSKSSDISFIYKALKNKVKSLKGIIVCSEYEGRSSLAIAIDKEKKDFLFAMVFEAISEAIIRSYKFDFLKNNLKLRVGDKITESAFIKALTVYDKNSDKDLIKKQLVPSEEILIDSFYNFRLWELEKRWKGVCELMSENASYLFMSGSFMDLLKFLILSCDNEAGEVHMHLGDGNIYCNEPSGRELFNMIFNDDENSKINILSELICLSPEKIVLHSNLENTSLAKDIVSLFDGRVSQIKK